MQIAILLFDRFAALDAVAFHEALGATADADIVFVAEQPGPVRDETGRLEMTADAALHEVPRPDIVVLPGGRGAALLRANGPVERWLWCAARASTYFITVADGALIAAHAGLATGRSVAAPAHLHAELNKLGVRPVNDVIVATDRVASTRDAASAAELGALLNLTTKEGHHR